MFKPHYGDCIECNRTRVIIAVKKGYCQQCNYEKKQEKLASKIDGRSTGADEAKYDRNGVLILGNEYSKGNHYASQKHKWTSRQVDKENTSPFPKTRKSFQRTKKASGEKETFEEIASEREWICFVSNKSLMELKASQFAHVLPKALNKYPLFKLYKKNIVILSDEAHYAWDFKPRSELKKDKNFDKLFELEEELKDEYEEFKKKNFQFSTNYDTRSEL